MSYHALPEYVAPDEIRCEALVRGQKGWAYDWAKEDHRCPRKCNQMRGQYQVCWQHAQMAKFVAFDGTS